MQRTYPALDVHGGETDLLLALVDDFAPTAIDEAPPTTRVFFAKTSDRDAAHTALAARFDVTPLDVPDDDWATRSQADLQPITVGRLTVFPNPYSLTPNPCSIVIPPSMAFGTGHHATTQLCLDALQAIDLAGTDVLDVGTGSGVLAMAAVLLGARRARGIDSDEDAIRTARENLLLNPAAAPHVAFDVADLVAADLREAFTPGVLVANLTGALLVRSAARLLTAAPSGGTLILSGIQNDERDEVGRAFAGAATTWERSIDDWVGVTLKKR